MKTDNKNPSYEDLFPEQEGYHEEQPRGRATELGFSHFYLGMKAYSWERIPDVKNDPTPRIYVSWQDSPYYRDPIDELPEPWAEARRVAQKYKDVQQLREWRERQPLRIRSMTYSELWLWKMRYRHKIMKVMLDNNQFGIYNDEESKPKWIYSEE
jgi:hypothetical protein